jgi:hypothetical protein
LFIISSGRAGTTLLRSMLVVGGQIAIPPESYVIGTAVRKFLSLSILGWADLSRLIVALFESHPEFPLWNINLQPAYDAALNLPPSEQSLARVIDEVFKRYGQQQFPQAAIWGDQSPANTLHLPRVFRTFPQAKYLHLLRDGRDVIASMVGKGDELADSTTRWRTCIQRALALQKRLRAEQFLTVRYESLVSNPRDTLAHVCEFSGVEYLDEMLDFWRSPTTVEHKHYEHHRNLGRPVFTTSIGGWQERLSPPEQEYVLSHISDLLRSLEYMN